MKLHQLKVEYDAEQDRLIMLVATSELVELRLALTRRFVKLLWPLLVKLAEEASPRIRTQPNPEARKALLSIEQAFRNVQSLSAHARDSHVRRILLFDTLDTLEGLRSPDFARMCELSYAQRALDEVTSLLSPEAGRVLLPRATLAVDALKQLQDGFFVPSRPLTFACSATEDTRSEAVRHQLTGFSC